MAEGVEKAIAERVQTIQKLAEEQEETGEQLKKDYLERQQIGVYNYFRTIPQKSFFAYAVIFFLLFFVINLLNFTMKHIIIIIICSLFTFYLNEMRKSTSVTRMQELELKLNSIFPRPKYFFIDSGIIELIHSIKEYKHYNPLAFNKLIRVIDSFLKLTLDIEKRTENCYALYDILQNMKDSALNNLHSIIYNNPHDINAEVKLDRALVSLHYILNFHLEQIRIKCNKDFKEKGPNINNRYINSNIHPEGRDPLFNNRFDLY
jgi:hypothetical protein